jgi:hypothetical protein
MLQEISGLVKEFTISDDELFFRPCGASRSSLSTYLLLGHLSGLGVWGKISIEM